MKEQQYQSMEILSRLNRRDFFKTMGAGAAAAGGLVLGVPAFGQDKQTPPPPPVETNIDEFMKVPRGPHALPGPFPGRVVQVAGEKCLVDDKIDAKAVAEMVERGITTLTGKNLKKSFPLFFSKDDVVGIKVNPVGPPLIHTKPEVVEAVIAWLVKNGLPKKQIVIWDRFDYMLRDAGYTAERFPGIRLAGLQTMDEEGNKWRGPDGKHISEGNFDLQVYYYAKGILGKNVRGYKDDENYLNQHVFANEYSYFGKLVTQELTKIINIAAYKNTGNGISMATKNLGYGAICNCGRLHAPLFFRVCTEVLAAPCIREKLVLNIIDGIRGQYDGGPGLNAQFVYPHRTLYFATDPFAMDMICHRELVALRKEKQVAVNESPRFTEYLFQAEKLGLGVADPARIEVKTVKV